MTRQLALDLGHRTALGREDFLVSDCNATAIEWIDRWPDWPGHGLVVWGDDASGKTHLGHVWCAHAQARAVFVDRLDGLDVAATLAECSRIFVDDVGSLAGDRAREEALFHLYNRVVEARGSLLLTAGAPASRWPLAIADLASRMRALPAVEVGAPDDTLLAAVLLKQFADRQVSVGEEVIAYLLPRMERSFAGAARLVDAMDRRALEERRPVTVPLAREVIGGSG